MMGAEGLKHATEAAILAANYISHRLADHYPTLYASAGANGKAGLVAHECILDLRGLKETSGVMAEDVAKRLMDYGFHAPHVVFSRGQHLDGGAHRKRNLGRTRSLH